jgi:hypothetical protein
MSHGGVHDGDFRRLDRGGYLHWHIYNLEDKEWMPVTDNATMSVLKTVKRIGKDSVPGEQIFEMLDGTLLPAERFFPKDTGDERPQPDWFPDDQGESWRVYNQLLANNLGKDATEMWAGIARAARRGEYTPAKKAFLEDTENRHGLFQPPWWDETTQGRFKDFGGDIDELTSLRLQVALQDPNPFQKLAAAIEKREREFSLGKADWVQTVIKGTTFVGYKQADGKVKVMGEISPDIPEAERVEFGGRGYIQTGDGELIPIPPELQDSRIIYMGDLVIAIQRNGMITPLGRDSTRTPVQKPEFDLINVDKNNKFLSVDGALTKLEGEPEPIGQADQRRQAILKLDEQIDESITQGNFDYTKALVGIRDAPDKKELFELALQFARSPGDSLILQNIQRGLAHVERPPIDSDASKIESATPLPRQLGVLPKSASLTSAYADVTRDPFADPALRNPPPNIARERQLGGVQRLEQMLTQMAGIERRIGELRKDQPPLNMTKTPMPTVGQQRTEAILGGNPVLEGQGLASLPSEQANVSMEDQEIRRRLMAAQSRLSRPFTQPKVFTPRVHEQPY